MVANLETLRGCMVSDESTTLPLDHLSDLGNHSYWRRFMAERIAIELDYEAFGVHGVYLIGSVERCEADMGSDIDIIVHMEDDEDRRESLLLWLDGWSCSLGLMNYSRTGYMSARLLDVHIVTDREVRQQDSFAIQMNDPVAARCLTGKY